jgi:hypothetical protein
MADTAELQTLRDRLRLHQKWTERYREAATRTSDSRCVRMADEHAEIADDIQSHIVALEQSAVPHP